MDMTVLIADDEELKVMTLKASLRSAGYQVETATNGERALEKLEGGKVHALVTDVRMPGMDGLDLLERSKELDPDRPVLVMTGFGAVEDAVKAMRLGAEDYMIKPVSAEEIIFRLEKAFAHAGMTRERDRLKEELERLGGDSQVVVASTGMRAVFEKIERAAETDATVLLHGETGVGKEVCARYLHDCSKRADGPFVALSCAALAPGLVESEIFGHEKGAFTGAAGKRDGRLAMARGGTLFLDDVDDIPLEVQTKLLRVLETSSFERVGGTEEIEADVRFVAATKRDLDELVAKGLFRDDLMYRLKVVQVDIPPLRSRIEEVEPLSAHFLLKSLRRMGRSEKMFDEETIEIMKKYSWPGNVRELEHVIASLVAIHEGERIRPEDLPERIANGRSQPLFVLNIDGKENIRLEEAMVEFESKLLSWALEKAEGSQAGAAKILDIPRSTFQYRLTKVNKNSKEAAE